MQLSKFEQIIIILILVVGLLGGVGLVYLDSPPIIPSVFIAMGIATLVYHFLGGIDNAVVNIGVVKLGGSIAALIGSAYIINSQLTVQVINLEEEFHINSKYEIFNSQNKRFGKILLNNFHLKLNTNYEITGNDTIKLGTLNSQDLIDFGILNKLELNNYTEIKYNTRLESPLEFKIDTEPWTDVNGYRATYQDLPFDIVPFESRVANFKTKIVFNRPDLLDKECSLSKGQTIYITDFYKEKSVIYIIRVRQLVESAYWSSYDNFVQYQIFEFSGILK